MKQHLGQTVIFTLHLAREEGKVFQGKVNQISKNQKFALIGHNWYQIDKVKIEEVLSPVADAPKGDPEKIVQAFGQEETPAKSTEDAKEEKQPAHKLPWSITEAAPDGPSRETTS